MKPNLVPVDPSWLSSKCDDSGRVKPEHFDLRLYGEDGNQEYIPICVEGDEIWSIDAWYLPQRTKVVTHLIVSLYRESDPPLSPPIPE